MADDPGPGATDGPDPLLDALHRLYIASLPDDLQARVADRVRPAVRALSVVEAARIVSDATGASGRLDRLQTWHLAAAIDHRRRDLTAQPGEVNQAVAMLVAQQPTDSPIVEQAAERLRTDRSRETTS